MFRIEKKPGTGHKTYTHNVYLKDKLLSDQGYFHKDYFAYDNYNEALVKELFRVKVSELPDRAQFRTFYDSYYREFEFSYFMRHGNKIEVKMYSNADDFNKSLWNFMAFAKRFSANGKKMYRSRSHIYDAEAGMNISFSVPWLAGEKVKDARDKLKKMLGEVYDKTEKDLIEQAKAQRKKS